MIWLLMAVAGALGSACRYLIDVLISQRFDGRLPWGTVFVNISGSFVTGIVGGFVITGLVPEELGTVLAGGFLGAYTTFSTAMYETVRLWEQGHRLESLANSVAPLAFAIAAATFGWWLVT